MKINFIFRSSKHNRFSIENVFNSIANEIGNNHHFEKSYVPEPTISIKNIFINIISAHKLVGDVFHITGDVHYVSLALKKCKTILTIHDLVTLNNKTGLRKLFIELMWFRIPILKSKYVTVISHKTAKELCQRFPSVRKKLFVINNPIDNRFKYIPKVFNKELPVLLQIGTKSNKNLERVIQAIEGIPCILEIIGILTEDQKKLLDEKKINYRNCFNLSIDDVIQKYQQCDITLFVSTYEGFGMPIVESQAVGRAVITSNISPMVEVSGNGACIVNPYEIESIRAGIIRLINDDSFRNKLIEQGKANVSKFSAKVIAQEYQEIYNKIVCND